MIFSKNSQLILRHQKIFKNKIVFFSGNIEDELPINLLTIKTKIHLQKSQNFLKINNNKNITFYRKLLVSQDTVQDCNILIYYWPKNKSEARFQLFNILSFLPIKSEIFIVGSNSSGVKSAKLILEESIKLKKIDNANHSILMSGILINKTKFKLEKFFKIHIWKNLIIKSLPGVFGHKKIDEGSKFIASTFSEKINGKILDVGCGSGFLSVSILRKSPKCVVTMIDRKLSALESSKATLDANFFKGEVLSSNIYSNIFKKFNMIVSNPPLHDDLKINFDITKKIIFNSKKHLKKNGELRFVTNHCFSYDFYLKKVFSEFHIMKKDNKYKVYQAFLK
ncbi:16S rRNA (guanine(1207)-N(2))-methyltransferase RsmC [Buchnera aphidicola]|uniref:Ribosomal RNA small subunit methyltransferase C n=1 Tax=Buchnera aphidicola subsp. Schizaphis graminum (strain Sg) TaxID=198804 RepID=RSMC_BUCAP|nr:16S rRNA (guanine(1207)-N(2))-methyltransferase RsmC [Buchnera aphidicola]Q8K9L5.2 RecName: Full=Ribosomal RNA small subunit methyltransferase C; AltName: Full=16S rRNA m2G1207 methyltransferase; AltName: Full=rRNA (guanine-N(2)-)-methyltransferase RsmC [Buchnera aphidicola str. Sg (Schizaphis graminum)]AWI49632.1 16S rRNA methyltransferase [Buchnera aphidicola (Schizaphis graminum)]